MVRKPPKQRIKKVIDTGGGPNGEDIIQWVDSETGDVIREELSHSEAPALTQEEGEESPSPGRLLTAQEMLRLALKEREESYGRRVRELVSEILEGCRQDILKGKYTYTTNVDTGPPGEIIKGAVKELKNLGYKARQLPDPENGLVDIVVSWPTKLKAPKKGKAPPPPPVEEPKKKRAAKKPRKEVADSVDEDQMIFSFTKSKE